MELFVESLADSQMAKSIGLHNYKLNIFFHSSQNLNTNIKKLRA